MSSLRLAEAAVVGVAGAALGALAGSFAGLSGPMAAIAGANGVVSGWRGIYDRRSRTGVLACALDSTWAISTTAAGLVSHAVGAVRGNAGYSTELSERRNRHVYASGFQLRPKFAVTLGNVVSGAGDLSHPRRARLVTDHEDVHVWQARWFGPMYPILYGGWMIGGGLAGAVIWAVGRRDEPFRTVVETCAYYMNPFEWWAYSRDANWPPPGVAERLAPPRPVVRSFASFR